MNWISVKEQLPKDNQAVNITWVNHAEYVKSIMTPVEMPSGTVFICGNAESVQELMERI